MCCGYSLEAPLRGTSNEYHMFLLRNKKNVSTFWLKKAPPGVMEIPVSSTDCEELQMSSTTYVFVE